MTDDTFAQLQAEGIISADLRIMTRSAFDKLSPSDQIAHIRAGRTVADDPVAPPPAREPAPAGCIYRANFETMPEAVRRSLLRSGTRIID